LWANIRGILGFGRVHSVEIFGKHFEHRFQFDGFTRGLALISCV
jgi:hypothetical protein